MATTLLLWGCLSISNAAPDPIRGGVTTGQVLTTHSHFTDGRTEAQSREVSRSLHKVTQCSFCSAAEQPPSPPPISQWGVGKAKSSYTQTGWQGRGLCGPRHHSEGPDLQGQHGQVAEGHGRQQKSKVSPPDSFSLQGSPSPTLGQHCVAEREPCTPSFFADGETETQKHVLTFPASHGWLGLRRSSSHCVPRKNPGDPQLTPSA